MTAETQKKERFLERHSWKWFIVIAVIFGLFGIGDVILGMDADPAIAEGVTGVAWKELQVSNPRIASLIDLYVRPVGMYLVILSITTVTITLVGFRQGDRWAWYVLWIWPLAMASTFLMFFTVEMPPGFPAPPPMLSAPVFLVLSVLALLLPYRKFFPKV